MSDNIQNKLHDLIILNTSQTESDWIIQKSSTSAMDLMTGFVSAPRNLSKKIIQTSSQQAAELQELVPNFSIEDWSLVRLVRVWLLTQLESKDPEHFINNIDTLFDTAELNELVALYSALPLLSFPQQWLFRATDAVRSNMGFVFDAIALRNPYPALYFSEPAWNQLVLKTIFNDKPTYLIPGREKRTNQALAATLSDFAHERWAAGRSVPAPVWNLVTRFVDDTILSDLKHLFKSEEAADRIAAALVCAGSDYKPAQELLAQYPDLQDQVVSGKISWKNLEIQ
jgi:hypothetical protein